MFKAILFCNLAYSFAILKPLANELKKRGINYIWYVPMDIVDEFCYKDEEFTSKISDLKIFNSDMIFVPGNDVPHFLRGVKVQVFHGLAGEKKGHFRIRDYFDLYLTQGPYFTIRFKELQLKHKNFEVIESGWCKLDNLFEDDKKLIKTKEDILRDTDAKKVILYAPTFSPSLTSAPILFDEILKLSFDPRFVVIIKFHDKMDIDIVKRYKNIKSKKLIIPNEDDITPLLKISDLMISDTSSVVYEFLLLDKPVITLKSKSENINWLDLKDPSSLIKDIETTLYVDDAFREKREKIISLYHPYRDGKSASRMVDATLNYIERFKVPTNRKLPLLRRFKMIKKYGV